MRTGTAIDHVNKDERLEIYFTCIISEEEVYMIFVWVCVHVILILLLFWILILIVVLIIVLLIMVCLLHFFLFLFIFFSLLRGIFEEEKITFFFSIKKRWLVNNSHCILNVLFDVIEVHLYRDRVYLNTLFLLWKFICLTICQILISIFLNKSNSVKGNRIF